MLSAVPIQRLFHQLAWNYFERFHRPLNKTNNARAYRAKSRQRRQKGRNCFSKNRVWMEKRKEGKKGKEREREQRFAKRHSCSRCETCKRIMDVFFINLSRIFSMFQGHLVIFSFFCVFLLEKKL